MAKRKPTSGADRRTARSRARQAATNAARSAKPPANQRSATRKPRARPGARKPPKRRSAAEEEGAASRKPGQDSRQKASAKAAGKPVKKPAGKVVKQGRRRPQKAAAPRSRAAAPAAAKRPRLDRQRRTLEETVQTPPSSLEWTATASAARSGRAALRKSLKEHTGMTPELTAGDVDADWENAYFSGEEAPGGDNPTPDQNVVDDIGKALGVEYQDDEELKASDKVVERDEHRWELDPASAEDYKDRK